MLAWSKVSPVKQAEMWVCHREWKQSIDWKNPTQRSPPSFPIIALDKEITKKGLFGSLNQSAEVAQWQNAVQTGIRLHTISHRTQGNIMLHGQPSTCPQKSSQPCCKSQPRISDESNHSYQAPHSGWQGPIHSTLYSRCITDSTSQGHKSSYWLWLAKGKFLGNTFFFLSG